MGANIIIVILSVFFTFISECMATENGHTEVEDPSIAAWESVWRIASEYLQQGGTQHPDYGNFFEFILTSPYLQGYSISDEGMQLWVGMRLPLPQNSYINPQILEGYQHVVEEDITQTSSDNDVALRQQHTILASIQDAFLQSCRQEFFSSIFQKKIYHTQQVSKHTRNPETKFTMDELTLHNCINVAWANFGSRCSARNQPFLHYLRNQVREHFFSMIRSYEHMHPSRQSLHLDRLLSAEGFIVSWQEYFPHALAIWSPFQETRNCALSYNWRNPQYPKLKPQAPASLL